MWSKNHPGKKKKASTTFSCIPWQCLDLPQCSHSPVPPTPGRSTGAARPAPALSLPCSARGAGTRLGQGTHPAPVHAAGAGRGVQLPTAPSTCAHGEGCDGRRAPGHWLLPLLPSAPTPLPQQLKRRGVNRKLVRKAPLTTVLFIYNLLCPSPKWLLQGSFISVIISPNPPFQCGELCKHSNLSLFNPLELIKFCLQLEALVLFKHISVMSETLVLKGWFLFCFLIWLKPCYTMNYLQCTALLAGGGGWNFSTSHVEPSGICPLQGHLWAWAGTQTMEDCLFFKKKPILGSRAITPLCRYFCPSAKGCANHTAPKMLPEHSRQELVVSLPLEVWFAKSPQDWRTPGKILSQPTETTRSMQQKGFKLHRSFLCLLWTMKRKPRICKAM